MWIHRRSLCQVDRNLVFVISFVVLMLLVVLWMVYIFTEPKVTMDVDMMAERSMHITGFLFLNINNRIGKQNSVCISPHGLIRTHIPII